MYTNGVDYVDEEEEEGEKEGEEELRTFGIEL